MLWLRSAHLESWDFISAVPGGNWFVVVRMSFDCFVTIHASPRGGEPGFVKVHDQHTLLIPDAQGNNLLDTLTNLPSLVNDGLGHPRNSGVAAVLRAAGLPPPQLHVEAL